MNRFDFEVEANSAELPPPIILHSFALSNFLPCPGGKIRSQRGKCVKPFPGLRYSWYCNQPTARILINIPSVLTNFPFLPLHIIYTSAVKYEKCNRHLIRINAGFVTIKSWLDSSTGTAVTFHCVRMWGAHWLAASLQVGWPTAEEEKVPSTPFA